MIYLLAKYTLLFLMASILGFVLGYWWSRRNFVDVSESYEDLRKAAADIAPPGSRLQAREVAVREIPRSAPQKEIDSRLRSIESEIGRLGERPTSRARPASQTRDAAEPDQAPGEPKILSAALYGQKDDLKQISGVGPKLEKLLNSNGIFYFWQVASWSRRDIEVIDERLDTFKGRILRDEWVSQAKRLKGSPEAASMPAA